MNVFAQMFLGWMSTYIYDASSEVMARRFDGPRNAKIGAWQPRQEAVVSREVADAIYASLPGHGHAAGSSMPTLGNKYAVVVGGKSNHSAMDEASTIIVLYNHDCNYTLERMSVKTEEYRSWIPYFEGVKKARPDVVPMKSLFDSTEAVSLLELLKKLDKGSYYLVGGEKRDTLRKVDIRGVTYPESDFTVNESVRDLFGRKKDYSVDTSGRDMCWLFSNRKTVDHHTVIEPSIFGQMFLDYHS